jgi:hypothetical protein
MAAYLATMAPSVTWRNGGADGAELAAAAYVWGVAHPPGYPLYLTLARLFQALPVGEPIWRAALLSAVAAAVAVGLVQALVLDLVRQEGERGEWRARVSAAFGAATFGFGALVWSQATIAEVYTLGAALLAAFLLALVRWLRRPTRRRSVAVAGLLALLASHQPTFAAAVPLVAWLAHGRGVLRRDWGPGLLALLVGPVLLATLWPRAAAQPAVNWGDPSSAERWLAHVTAQQYRGYLLEGRIGDRLARAPAMAGALLAQTGTVALAAAIVGAAWLWVRERALVVIAALMCAFFGSFAVLYNARDSEVHLIPVGLLVAVAAGVGAYAALGWLRGAIAAAGAAGLAWSVVMMLVGGWPRVDVSRDVAARSWAETRLRDVPPGAVYRTESDEQAFALWYVQVVHGMRPDVAVVDDRLLVHDWYRRQLARRYPALASQFGTDPPPRPPSQADPLPTRRPPPRP